MNRTVNAWPVTLLIISLFPISALAVPPQVKLPGDPEMTLYDDIERNLSASRNASGAVALSAIGLPDISANWSSANSPWVTGVNWGGETYFGSIDKGINFFGSNVSDDAYVPVELRFDPADTTLCHTYRRDLGYPASGVGIFVGSAWDMSDPGNPRRLNILFVEDGTQLVPNQEWNPNSLNTGGREYLYIMNSTYDGDGMTYSSSNFFSDAPSMDILYAWWPRVPGGQTLYSETPVSITITPYYVTSLRGIPDSGQVTLTWNLARGSADQFYIYSDASEPVTTLLDSVDGTQNSLVRSGLTNGVTEYYRVEALDALGDVIDTSLTAAATPQVVSLQTSLLGFWNGRSTYGDIWGYTDPNTSKEYALICARNDGLSIIDLDTDPLEEVGFAPSLPGASDAKDVKIYQNYAFLVHEAGPIQIIDIADPTNPTDVATFTPDGNGSHNCLIDGDYLYVIGNHGVGGLEIVDISNPASPVEVGDFQPFYYHDIDVRNDTLCGTGIYGDGIDLVDVSDKSNPSLITRWNYTGSGSHNAEFTPDGNYVFIGDEIGSSGNHIRTFDISDPGNVQLASEMIVDPNAVVHNCYQLNDLLYIAHYTEGLRIWNIEDPASPYEVGYYDTYPPNVYGFSGAWSVYPYFESGRIIVSDMATGLYVVEADSSIFPDPGCCVDLRGNADGDPGDVVDVGDLTFLIGFCFLGGPPPECWDEGNVDAIGIPDVGDLTALIGFLFLGGASPAACP